MAAKIVAETPGAFGPASLTTRPGPRYRPGNLAANERPGRRLGPGVGSGGTITGTTVIEIMNPDMKVVVADPVGSVVAPAVETGEVKYDGGSWLVEGIGEDFIPDNLDLAVIDDGVVVSDREAFQTVNDLLRVEGILAGSSAGTLVAGALAWCRRQSAPKNVVTFICDTGNKYLSKAFEDGWLQEQGLIDRPQYGDLRDCDEPRRRRAGDSLAG